MKRFGIFAVIIVLISGFLGLGIKSLNQASGQGNADKTLTIFNWGDYIDPQLITKFEHETGYQVKYETFDSNEAMFTKIQQGGTAYDIAVPSDYMIEKMRKAHLLVPLSKQKIVGLSNIEPEFLDQSFDQHNQYSVPYFWGTLGIIYNDRYVKASEMQHWRDLWQPKWRNSIMLVDSARDIMGLALVKDGASMNSTNQVQLQKAATDLDQLAPNVKAVVADEIKMYMSDNEAPLAVTWSGEAAEMLANNSHLHYVVPSEGSNLWFDNIVIPRTVKHKKAAYAFINFMLQPKNAAQNAEYIGYATPNRLAKRLLPKAIREDKQFYPDQQTVRNLQVYQDLGPTWVQRYNDLFLEFKMHK
ncbi:ABC transporter substrate-binding protein [Agrilactobacillus fermenti]|uniref:ABC transporter substrate-binding protein n=1 Tax=Agrilactobacillus fermenti TaxID=2586909 RepID=UPI003A5C6A65